MLKYILTLIVFLIAIAVVWVRLAPFDSARFHTPVFPAAAGDYQGQNSFIAIREMTASSDEVIAALDEVIMQSPRTKRMVGLPGMELITYETRSALMGFPDYTNVSIIDRGAVGNLTPLLAIRGKARFGQSDMGVNKARIEGWLEALGPLTVAP